MSSKHSNHGQAENAVLLEPELLSGGGNEPENTSSGTPAAAKPPRVRYSRKIRGIVITAISLLTLASVVFIGGGGYSLALILSVDYYNQGGVLSEIPLESDELGGTDTLDGVKIWDGATRVTDIPLQGDTKQIQNILILGIDSRSKNSYSGRSDTMIIMTINHSRKTIQLTSLLRDTCVAIAGRDADQNGQDDLEKLAHAYAYGRFDGLSKTIEQNFRLRITKHVAVNFGVFESCIDTIGGINLDLTSAEAGHIGLAHKAGNYKLNGFYALEYARIRKLDSDYARTGRHRAVLTALIDKAKGMNVVTMVSLLDKIFPNISTSMTSTELTNLVMDIPKYTDYKIISNEHFPNEGDFTPKTTPASGFVEEINNPAETVTKLHHMLYD